MQSSSGTEDSRPSRPLYRGIHPLKPSDIHLLVDISAEHSNSHRKNREGREYDPLYDDSSDDEAPSQQSPTIPSHMLDKFPSPPNINAYTTPNLPPNPRMFTRPQPANHPYPTEADILSLPAHPYLERLEREKEHLRQLERVNRIMRQPVKRSSSTASYSRPTQCAYPTLANSPSPPSHTNRSHTRPPSAQRPTYNTAHSNLSMRDLGPRARLADGPTAQRPVVRQASTPAIHHPEPVKPLQKLGPYHPDVVRVVHGPEKAERMRLRSSPSQYTNVKNGGYNGYNGYQDTQCPDSGTRAATVRHRRAGRHL